MVRVYVLNGDPRCGKVIDVGTSNDVFAMTESEQAAVPMLCAFRAAYLNSSHPSAALQALCVRQMYIDVAQFKMTGPSETFTAAHATGILRCLYEPRTIHFVSWEEQTLDVAIHLVVHP